MIKQEIRYLVVTIHLRLLWLPLIITSTLNWYPIGMKTLAKIDKKVEALVKERTLLEKEVNKNQGP